MAFEKERREQYAMVELLEQECGYALDGARLEEAACILACPLKLHPPNWQHGRVLYALTRRYLEKQQPKFTNILDIGTAKGFSALCLQWALMDAGAPGRVTSVDIVNPRARVKRNTVAEANGLLTLEELLRPWPDALSIVFTCADSVEFLQQNAQRWHIAFVDGKHEGGRVQQEGRLLASLQKEGDIAVFDDVHLPDVEHAVSLLKPWYRTVTLEVLLWRHYAIGVRQAC